MPQKKASRVLREAIAKALRQLLTNRGLRAADLARALGVSRQAVSQYLQGRTAPSRDVLAMALKRWEDLIIEVDGKRFDAEAFQWQGMSATPPAIQLNIPHLKERPTEIEIPGTGLRLRIAATRADTLEVAVKFKLTG